VQRLKNLLKNVALVLASCLIAGSIGEGMVLLFLGEQPKFPRHVVGSSFGLRINQPNARYRQKWADGLVHVRINGQGLRADHDFSYAKPDGVKRIVSLGDSFTMGYEVEQDQTFSAIVEQQLRLRGINAEVLNTGVSGYGNAEELLYLERELLKYNPDIVLLSFTPNDLEDNVRTNLFKLVDGKLVEADSSYIPAGKIANFLNTNPIANLLSERSNLFVFLKEQTTLLVKSRTVQKNMEAVEQKDVDAALKDPEIIYQRQLAGAIFERLYQLTRSRNIPLVIHSIPAYLPVVTQFVEVFPFDEFNLRRPGILFLASKPLLDPYLGKQTLVNLRATRHWSAFSHRIAGEALAKLIMEGVFDQRLARPGPSASH
jgi:hypothetical protein